VELSTYEQLTGLKVSSARNAIVTAAINRSQAILETMLGFTLDPEKVETNLYNELGKSRSECSCPSVNTDNLDDADEVVGSYRLFMYDPNDKYFHVDPFVKLHKVKLVWVRPGDSEDNPQGVTIKTFDADDIRVELGHAGWAKYIEHCLDCLCVCDCKNCVQLAVDADWAWDDSENIPQDLLYLWADMVTYYSNPKKDIKSESITTHSYTKFDNTAPQDEPHNLAVIRKYAGQHGSAVVMPV